MTTGASVGSRAVRIYAPVSERDPEDWDDFDEAIERGDKAVPGYHVRSIALIGGPGTEPTCPQGFFVYMAELQENDWPVRS